MRLVVPQRPWDQRMLVAACSETATIRRGVTVARRRRATVNDYGSSIRGVVYMYRSVQDHVPCRL